MELVGGWLTENGIEGIMGYSTELRPQAKCQQVEELGAILDASSQAGQDRTQDRERDKHAPPS